MVQFMLETDFVFNIIIRPKRITFSETVYLIRYEITENIDEGFFKRVLLNRVPSSTNLHPPPPS